MGSRVSDWYPRTLRALAQKVGGGGEITKSGAIRDRDPTLLPGRASAQMAGGISIEGTALSDGIVLRMTRS